MRAILPDKKKDWGQSVDCLMSMGLADRLGKGPEPMAFISTLRNAADYMEALLEPRKP